MVTKFDVLGGKGARGFDPDQKIELLNMGKTELWKLLVGLNPQLNWFVKDSQASSSGADDYFAPLNTTTKDYALPPDFHQLRAIEVDTSGYTGVRFIKSNIDHPDFIWDKAKENQQFGSEANYDIIGTNPGTFRLSLLPPAAITLILTYCYKPTEWTALSGTQPDEFPVSTHGLIADWAVKRGLLGIGDKRMADFDLEWEERVKRYLGIYRRDNTESHVVRGFLE